MTGIKHIYTVVQPFPPSIFRTFPSPETSYPLNANSFFPPPAPGSHHFPSYLYECYSLGTLMSGIMEHLSFCVWLISLSIMPSRFIHGAAGVRPRCPSILRLKTSPCVTTATFRLFIHQWTPSYLQASDTVDNAATGMVYPVPLSLDPA